MSYGVSGYGTAPYGGVGTEIRAYFDMGMVLSADLSVVLYVSNAAGYATLPTDSLRSQPFEGRLERFSFQRSILQGDIGQFTTGSGQLVIKNTDGEEDQLAQIYTVDGRPIEMRIARMGGSYDDSVLGARITSSGWSPGSDSLTVSLVDLSYRLNVPMQPNVYGGTGGADGGADVAGKRKPMAFGTPQNISLAAVDPSLLIYQAHDGALSAIGAVYDQGVALTSAGDVADYATLAAALVAANAFKTCLAAGCVKLGTSPAGQVTADVDSGLYTTANIVRWAIANRTALVDPVDLAVSSFDDLNAMQPAPVDFFLGPDDDLTVGAFVQKLMGGVGGWGGHRLDGTFEVRIFEAPSGSPAASFTRDDMLDPDIQKEPLPDAYNPPPTRWRVPYARNWTVQDSGLAGAVSATRKATLAEPYRLAEVSLPSVAADHPFAQDRDPVDAYFALPEHAQAEAQRRGDLFKVTRALYRMRVPRRALRRDMGDVIMVTHPRHDLSFGRLMTIVEVNIDIDFSSRKLDAVELVAYG